MESLQSFDLLVAPIIQKKAAARFKSKHRGNKGTASAKSKKLRRSLTTLLLAMSGSKISIY